MLKLFTKLYTLTGATVGGYVFYENYRHIAPMLPPHIGHNKSDEIKKFITKIILVKSIGYGLIYPVTVSRLIEDNTKNIFLPLYTLHLKYTIDGKTFEKLPNRQVFEQKSPFDDKNKIYINGTLNIEKNDIVKFQYFKKY